MIRRRYLEKGTFSYIVDESAASDVDVFPVERILEKPYDILTNSVLRFESLGPGEEFTGINGCLLDGEAKQCHSAILLLVEVGAQWQLKGPSHLNVKPRCKGSWEAISDPISVKKASTESAM